MLCTSFVYSSVLSAQLSMLVGFTSLTWPSPMLPKLNSLQDNPLGRVITSSENSWLASLPILGICFGSVLFGGFATKYGRKTYLLSLGFPFLIFYLIMAWAKTIWLYYISRFGTGFALGGVLTILPMYSGELADPSNRGILGASMSVFATIGVLIPYFFGPFVSFFWYHISIAILASFYITLIAFFSFESPHFLIEKNYPKAESILRKLRGNESAAKNLKEIRENMENASRGSLMEIVRSGGLRKAFIIGIGAFTFTQLTGVAVTATYTQSIFESAGGSIPAELGPIIVGIAQLITTIMASVIADKFPRKLLLTISHFGVAAVEIPFGFYFYLKDRGDDVSNISYLPLICLILYVSIYNFGVAFIPPTLLGELFPSKVKGVAVSSIVLYNWGCSFGLTFLFNTLKDNLGLGCLFWIFSACGFLAIFFINFCMIETKGKTLQKIQNELNARE